MAPVQPYVTVGRAVRAKAAELVGAHAARLGMDEYGAGVLASVISKIAFADPSAPEWTWIDGVQPKLQPNTWVIVRHVGETRDEALAYREGYGEPSDTVHWSEVAEFRLKRSVKS